MAECSSKFTTIHLIPFTGGIFAMYAFFWPMSFATWLGGIVHTFRTVAGF